MQNKLAAGAFVVVAAGLLIPSWLVGLFGLVILSALRPWAGIIAGFCMDIIFGLPGFLPDWVGYPFMLVALVLGLASIVLEERLR